MPIRKIQFKKNEFYHIFNRGNGKENIFLDDKDRYRFFQSMFLSNNRNSFVGISALEKNKNKHTFEELKEILKDNKISYDPLVCITASCLMPDHFHFLLQEKKKKGISTFMQKLGNSYGKYFAKKYDRPGSLFAGRFKARHIKNDFQLSYIIAYINAVNPAQIEEPFLKIKGVENFSKVWERIDSYPWSTHQEFLNRRKNILFDMELAGKIFPTAKIYFEFIKEIAQGKRKDFWNEIKDLEID